MDGSLAYLVVGVGCLLAAIGVAAAVLAVVVARRQTARRTAAKGGRGPGADPFRDTDADALRGDPRQLRPGDIVEIRQVSYAVRGTLRFAEGSWSWAEHLLDDAQGGKVWLSVEEDPDLELVLWREVPGATVNPGPPSIDFDGRRYHSKESGRASYTATGTTGLNPTGVAYYHDYLAPDGARLSFESYGDGGRWEVGRGERLHRAEVQIYPQA
jgi:hypothetical protein